MPEIDFLSWKKLNFTPDLYSELAASGDLDLYPYAVNIKKGEAVFHDPDGGCCYTTLLSCDCMRFRNTHLPCRHIFRLAKEMNLKNSVNKLVSVSSGSLSLPVRTASSPVPVSKSKVLTPVHEKKVKNKPKGSNILWWIFILSVCALCLLPNGRHMNDSKKQQSSVGYSVNSAVITTTLDDIRHLSPDDVPAPSSRSSTYTGGSGGAGHDYVGYNTIIDEKEYAYIVNTSTNKIHYSDCAYVNKISPSNIAEIDDPDGMIAKGYSWCKKCHG